MKFYADSSNIDEVTKLKEHELIQGVTTNPTLIAKESHTRHWHEVIKEICDIVQGPVSAEVTHENYRFMLDEGRELAEFDSHVVVKLTFEIALHGRARTAGAPVPPAILTARVGSSLL